MDLPEHIHKSIVELAQKYGLGKVILFGSRARGDNRERSDVDLAVSGGDIAGFALDVDEIEIVPTLLMFDVVDLDSGPGGALLESIRNDGVVLYGKDSQ